MMVGRVFLVLTGACQFGHGVGGFTSNFIHSVGGPSAGSRETAPRRLAGAGPSAPHREPAPWFDPKHPPPCARWPGTFGS